VAITKAALSEHLITAQAFDKPTATLLVEEFFNQIAEKLITGETVKISGLGNFYLYHKKPRLARNPKNKQPVLISARRTVVFKAGEKLKEQVKHGVLVEDEEEDSR
jgi:integration host factor subunit alpha